MKATKLLRFASRSVAMTNVFIKERWKINENEPTKHLRGTP